MSIEYLFLYLGTVFIASIIPGPSMLLALNHGLKYGVRRTIASASGNVVASLLQALISITGLSIILTQSRELYSIIKYAGAAYLIYLGIRTLLERKSAQQDNSFQEEQVQRHSGNWLKLFSQAFVVAFCNPKAVIFFTALFPQFIESKGAPLPQIMLLLLLLCVIAFLCFMTYAFFGNKLTLFLFRPGRAKWFKRAIGTLFIALGAIVVASDIE